MPNGASSPPDAQGRTQLVAHTFTTSEADAQIELDDHHDEWLVSFDGDDFPRFTSIISYDPIV